jgi:hypothetical protein
MYDTPYEELELNDFLAHLAFQQREASTLLGIAVRDAGSPKGEVAERELVRARAELEEVAADFVVHCARERLEREF